MTEDSYQLNIDGVANLINSDTNKTSNVSADEVGELVDVLALDMPDEKLLSLKDQWQTKHDGYFPDIEKRSKLNKIYYQGSQYKSGLQATKGVSSNLIFEAQETFIPEALAKNPEPVVWSDNTPEGEKASADIKTMLQSKADTMGLRKKLAISLRHWSISFIGIMKHGWSLKDKDFTLMVKNPKNFVYDPDAFIDETGRYIGDFLGEKITVTAKRLIELFPKSKAYIIEKVDGMMGTRCMYTEWWTDEYCFSTFFDIVLDKHKNEFFNYDREEKHTEEDQFKFGFPETTVTPGKNHFAIPVMPYSFFSVFTLQEHPHDITNLIEQSIPNQDRISSTDLQISKNLRTSNNSIVLSGISFNMETGRQAAQALEDGDPVLVPDGEVEKSIKRLPASPLPSGLLDSQERDKQMLRSIFGTQGITPQQPTSSTTARGMILNQDQDSSRIGGGIGESLEQLADNVFNWWLQMMYVFYDEPHYAAIIGGDRSVNYVQIINSDINRQFVVSVSPNSMAPKDEISEQNQAVSLYQAGALDPLSLFQKLNFPDPQATALKTALWTRDPVSYMQQFLNIQPMQPQMSQPQNGPIPQQQVPQDTGLANPSPAQDLLQQVPINTTPQ